MAEIDFDRFGAGVAAALAAHGLSYAGAVARWPELDRGMLSRAVNGKPVSAANYVLLCREMGLEPLAFLRPKRPRTTLATIRKRLENQPVADRVERETFRGEQ